VVTVPGRHRRKAAPPSRWKFASAFRASASNLVISTVRDITERRNAEAEIMRLNRLYGVISQVNQAVVRATDQRALLDDVCRTLVDKGGFKLAWVGRVEPGSGRVVPAAAEAPRNTSGTL